MIILIIESIIILIIHEMGRTKCSSNEMLFRFLKTMTFLLMLVKPNIMQLIIHEEEYFSKNH